MTIRVFYNTSDDSSDPHVMLDEETYNAIKSLANRLNIPPEKVLVLAIERLRGAQATSEKLEKQLIEILTR
ncbi:hypothetical protein ANSO36C_43640 [Nostoc cf. commune SO-36]|uniref:Uncharacterized protein n=1 Tax=Nostoc cf. commune SO-36 TaxID=449208 RepID=A0ABN6QAU0_NOSCO|nr:hypothetical protein [Nostoc commune]BDI18562.1 hypothetical protein ANSO36C_43640 [Nostoc cf. commune SO-36]